MATSFVGYRLWAHTKALRKVGGNTGFVYAVLQLCAIVSAIATSSGPQVIRVPSGHFYNLYFSVSFVYPALTLAIIRGPFLNRSPEIYASVIEVPNSTPGV
ncbi:hypothetical protein H0H93_008948 [Arthromyces matolae]|nr:hypothetical protein H0H93_008948 [Arthromyces matolae]